MSFNKGGYVIFLFYDNLNFQSNFCILCPKAIFHIIILNCNDSLNVNFMLIKNLHRHIKLYYRDNNFVFRFIFENRNCFAN